jgi:hypothetical protein
LKRERASPKMKILLTHHTSKLIIPFCVAENYNIKFLQKLNLPTVGRGSETPLIMSGCINEGPSLISHNSGFFSIPPRSVRFWGTRPNLQWVASTSRRIQRPRVLHRSPPSSAPFMNAWTSHHSNILLRDVVFKWKYAIYLFKLYLVVYIVTSH